MSRVLVLWCPDWPAMTYGEDCTGPLAVIEGGEVLACTPPAREQGVRRGMRRREAQRRCTELVVRERRPLKEATMFDTVLLALAEHTVGVTVLRPGLCALPVPARFHGGEAEAAAVLMEAVVQAGIWDVRVGIADGVFAAEQAARSAMIQEHLIVPPGGSAAFVASLPVEVFDDEEFAALMRRLGLPRLADLAALGVAEVHTRFGTAGVVRHRLASGQERPWQGEASVVDDIRHEVHFEPPLDNAETVAFSCRRLAERFVAELQSRDAVCSVLRIECDSDAETGRRQWRHPRWFTTADLVDRIRWQAASWGQPVVTVRLITEVLERVGDHAEDLFGSGVDEGVERGIARVQGMLGPEAVRAVEVQGGRSPGERQVTSIWGERIHRERPIDRPWPAAIPAPAPATVLPQPQPVQVVGAEGQPVSVGERGGLIGGDLARIRVDRHWQQVLGWAGPWPVDERWWDEASAHRIARFQVVGVDGSAWLMSVRDGQWWIDAVYD